jgi:hypothetical protein
MRCTIDTLLITVLIAQLGGFAMILCGYLRRSRDHSALVGHALGAGDAERALMGRAIVTGADRVASEHTDQYGKAGCWKA